MNKKAKGRPFLPVPFCYAQSASIAVLPSLICKPSSVVYGHLSGRIVTDAFKRYSRHPSGEQPCAMGAQSCTGRGLHGTPRCRGVGELLPPLSILADCSAVCFCCTILGVASTGRYPASCSAVLGLSSWRNATRPYNQLGSLYSIAQTACICQVYRAYSIHVFSLRFACVLQQKVLQCICENFGIRIKF